MAFLGQTASSLAIGNMATQFFSMVLASNWLFFNVAKDIRNDAAAFNVVTQNCTDGSRAALSKCFSDMVKTYSDARR